jgi:hypothetical protein
MRRFSVAVGRVVMVLLGLMILVGFARMAKARPRKRAAGTGERPATPGR